MRVQAETFSLRGMARVAGASLWCMALLAGLAYGYAFPQFYHPDDWQMTIRELPRQEIWLRIMAACFMGILLLDVVVTWALYLFFQPRSASLSLLAALLRLVYAALLGGAIIPLVIIIPGPGWSESLVQPNLTAFLRVWSLGLILFGCHLLVLGVLMYRHPAMPRLLVGLTLVAGACYFAHHLALLCLPAYAPWQQLAEQVLGLPMALGELALATWLLGKGGRGED